MNSSPWRQSTMECYGRNGGPVDREGCGVPQNGGNGLVLERYGRNKVLFIGRGVVYRKTGLHGILFISTVDCLHGLLFIYPDCLHGLVFIHRRTPPASTCSCSSSLHRSSTCYCSSNPPPATVQPALHRLLFNQPSMGSCSSSPPRGLVHPALHRVLFIHRLDRSGYCSSSGNGLYYNEVMFIEPPTGNCSSKPPNNAHCSSRGSIDRLQLAAVVKESLGFS